MSLYKYILPLICPALSFAQGAAQVDLYDAGEATFEILNDLFPLDNGGMVAVGSSRLEAWILRTDEGGDMVWQRVRDGERSDNYSVIETNAGNILYGGEIGFPNTRFVAGLLAADGEQLWERTYDATRCQAVIELKDERFVLAGGATRYSSYIALTNSDGDPVWERNLDPDGYQSGIFAIREMEDGILAAGRHADAQGSRLYGRIWKVDFDGDVDWSRDYIIDEHRYSSTTFTSMISSRNGGYYIGGICQVGELRDRGAVYLLYIENNGDLIFQRAYRLERGGSPAGESLAQFANGTLLLVGWSHAPILGGGSAHVPLVLRINPDGEVIDIADSVAMADRLTPNTRIDYKSVVIRNGREAVIAGTLKNWDDEESGEDGALIRLEPLILGLEFYHISPPDSILTLLKDEEFTFSVGARNPWQAEMEYRWMVDGEPAGQDTILIYTFRTTGDIRASCQVLAGNSEIETGWLVHVRDLLIASHTPDTLSITLQRNSEIEFALDSVAYIGDRENLRYEWLLYDSAAVRWEEVGGDDRIGIRSYAFDWTGGYALKARVFDPNVDPVPADSVQWAIQVRGVIRAFEPNVPEISLEPRQEATFELIPFNANNDSIEFWWTLDGADTLSIESTLSISFQDTGRYVVSGYAREQVGEEEWEEDVQRWAVNVGMLSVDDFGLDSGFRRNDDPLMISIAPNPFNDQAMVTVDLGGRAFLPALRADKNVRPPSAQVGGLFPVRLSLYAIDGREILRLHDGPLSPGTHQFRFFTSFRMTSEVNMPSGVYFLRLQSGSHSRTVKAVLMR
ncbi:MAG: hypothetical protein FJY67_02560 [Calditrichaeota bacterium]|nr:hypothetical protein [Calditrichota bacterium]